MWWHLHSKVQDSELAKDSRKAAGVLCKTWHTEWFYTYFLSQENAMMECLPGPVDWEISISDLAGVMLSRLIIIAFVPP